MDSLIGLLGSQQRARLMAHMAVHWDSRLSMRELACHLGIGSTRSLRREVDRFVALGWLERRRSGREVRIAVNWTYPHCKALFSLIGYHAPTLILRAALAHIPSVKAAFIFGSRARGDARPDSDIDLLVYVDDDPEGAVSGAIIKAAIVLDYRLDVKRLDSEEFLHNAELGWGFLHNALREPKIWIVGSEADLPSIARAA